MIANSRLALAYGVAHFCLVADQNDIALLSDSLIIAGIDIKLEPGNTGYKTSVKLAAEFAKQKADILRNRLSGKSSGKVERLVDG